MFRKKEKIFTVEQIEEIRIKDFLIVSFRARSNFLPTILFMVTHINVCGQSGSFPRQPKNRQFLLILLTEIMLLSEFIIVLLTAWSRGRLFSMPHAETSL